MKYSDLVKVSIKKSGFKLQKISELIYDKTGSKPTIEYLSRVQNGKVPPASKNLNNALAEILGIDSVELKIAAYKEKIPKEVLEYLKNEKEFIS